MLKNLKKTKADDEPLALSYILKSNGIQDAIRALKCFDYLDFCLFLADVVESILSIYEKKHNDTALRDAINAIRLYKEGKISKKELIDIAKAANNDCVIAAATAANASYATASASYAATSAFYVTAKVVAAAYHDADNYDKAEKKWLEITVLFNKNFG